MFIDRQRMNGEHFCNLTKQRKPGYVAGEKRLLDRGECRSGVGVGPERFDQVQPVFFPVPLVGLRTHVHNRFLNLEGRPQPQRQHLHDHRPGHTKKFFSGVVRPELCQPTITSSLWTASRAAPDHLV